MNIRSFLNRLQSVTRNTSSRRDRRRTKMENRQPAATEILEQRALLAAFNTSILSPAQQIRSDSFVISNADTAASDEHIVVDANVASTGSSPGGEITCLLYTSDAADE